MKPRILVIEDEPLIPLVMRAWIERHTSEEGVPLEIENAKTLKEGFAAARNASVIVLDLGLPDCVDAHATAQRIPELRLFAPVIVLTALEDARRPSESELLLDCVKNLGAECCVFKGMLDSSGLEWFMLIVQSAMCRRIFEKQSRDGLYMPARRQYKHPWNQPELKLNP